MNVLVVAAVVGWATNRPGRATAPVDTWKRLDAPARCARALTLVRHPNPWPLICRWRLPDDKVLAASFPPPVGQPPWDHPRIEVYLARDEAISEVARVIAHEMGHMQHTREPTFGAEWLAARNLPPDTDSSIWVEDYAEVFAALYGPPSDWRASTPRPTQAQLDALKSRFFE